MVDLNNGEHNLLDREHESGLDVCFDDGKPAVLVYAECSETEWKNGVEALSTIAKMHDVTIAQR